MACRTSRSGANGKSRLCCMTWRSLQTAARRSVSWWAATVRAKASCSRLFARTRWATGSWYAMRTCLPSAVCRAVKDRGWRRIESSCAICLRRPSRKAVRSRWCWTAGLAACRPRRQRTRGFWTTTPPLPKRWKRAFSTSCAPWKSWCTATTLRGFWFSITVPTARATKR